MSLEYRIGLSVIALALSLLNGTALAEVVAIVSSKSPVTVISRLQVADIFLGRAQRFPGGERAVPVDQPEGSAARDEFYARYAGKSAPQVKAHWAKIIFTGRGLPPEEVSTNMEIKARVAKNPHAIGYIEDRLVDGSVRVLLAE